MNNENNLKHSSSPRPGTSKDFTNRLQDSNSGDERNDKRPSFPKTFIPFPNKSSRNRREDEEKCKIEFCKFIRLMQLFPVVHPASLHSVLSYYKNNFTLASTTLHSMLMGRRRGRGRSGTTPTNHPYNATARKYQFKTSPGNVFKSNERQKRLQFLKNAVHYYIDRLEREKQQLQQQEGFDVTSIKIKEENHDDGDDAL